MSLEDPVPSAAFDVLKRNAQDVDRFVNQDSGTFENRTGDDLTPLPVVNQQATDLLLDIEERFNLMQSGEFTARAEAAANEAELAADVAQLSAGIYADVSAGLAATASGDYFNVPSADVNNFVDLYLNTAGSAVFVKSYFSSEAIRKYAIANDPISKSSDPDTAFTLTDEAGNSVLKVDEDGVFRAYKFADLKTTDADIVKSSDDSRELEIMDEDGNIVFSVGSDGKLSSEISRIFGTFPFGLNFINNAGQSLGEGSDGALTLVSEFDNAGFPARSGAPLNLLPLQISTTQFGSTGESPMYAACSHIKELIASENGLDFIENGYQLAACNNAYSATSIADMSKGGVTGSFEDAIAQAARVSEIASERGQKGAFGATFWTQGERDVVLNTEEIDYYNAIMTLADDFNSDGKSATGQYSDIPLICYQTSRSNAYIRVAPAQLKASNNHPLIHMACPIYFMEFYDFQHINAESSQWLGAYYGAVYKRVVIDEKEWKPLQPVSHTALGNTIILNFNKDGLVFDTSTVPLQPNYGFACVNDLGASVSITNVELVGTHSVRITLDTAVSPKFIVTYANNSAVDRLDAFTGCCGNLRDNAGDYLKYRTKPLHNWSVIFKYEV